MNYHLAQINIAHMLDARESETMRSFMEQLDHINSIADQSRGFVWRLQDEEGDATAIVAYDDPMIIVNMSVWENIEALHRYVYDSEHLQLLKDKKRWFKKVKEKTAALWWLPAGHIPTVDEGKRRLAMLNAKGPTPDAFTFARHFPAPDQAGGEGQLQDCANL